MQEIFEVGHECDFKIVLWSFSLFVRRILPALGALSAILREGRKLTVVRFLCHRPPPSFPFVVGWFRDAQASHPKLKLAVSPVLSCRCCNFTSALSLFNNFSSSITLRYV